MLFIFPTALFFEAAALVSIPHTHSRPIVMALSNWIGPSQWDIFRQAGLMIGFGAGVGQMNAVFGLQTFCNEQVGGGKRACVEEQRSCCWPSKLRDLPASPWDKSVTLGLMAGLLLPLAWILYTTCAGEKCSLNRAAHCRWWRAQGRLVFSLAVATVCPYFQASQCVGCVLDIFSVSARGNWCLSS